MGKRKVSHRHRHNARPDKYAWHLQSSLFGSQYGAVDKPDGIADPIYTHERDQLFTDRPMMAASTHKEKHDGN